MDERRGDQGFAVVTQSVSGRPGGGRKGPRRVGVAIVGLASLALIAVGFVGPRLSGLPNFDLAYFATPTPGPTARPTPTPTPTLPGSTPRVTPLPELTRPDGVPPLDGELILGGGSIQRFDLATGTSTALQPMSLWQDAVVIDPDGGILCVCITDDTNERGLTRVVRLARITGDAVVSSVIGTFQTAPAAVMDQPDPLLDVAFDRSARSGKLAVAARSHDGWNVSIRTFDARTGDAAADVPIGAIVVPAPAPSPSPTPTPTLDPGVSPQNVYLDGPHIRVAPDGRTAFVWATGQRYSDQEPAVSVRRAWRIHFDATGSVEDVAEASGLAASPDFCTGSTFITADRFAALCAGPSAVNTVDGAPWSLRLFDLDGTATGAIGLPDAGQYGWGEPLVDQANGRMYLWDPIDLSVARVDVASGSVASATFDPAAGSALGVTSGSASRPPAWHDGDSAVQQSMFEGITGSADGTRLFAVGFKPDQTTDYYVQKSYGVFVIDPFTLALAQHWAPVANDTWVAPIDGERVAVGAQPGMNAEGQQVPWQGSLSIREAADGRILARYGTVSTDMPPVLIRP